MAKAKRLKLPWSHVLEWWSGEASLEDVRAKYLPRIRSATVRSYLAYLGSEPIGYIQSYVAVETEDGWWIGSTDPGVLGKAGFRSQGVVTTPDGPALLMTLDRSGVAQ